MKRWGMMGARTGFIFLFLVSLSGIAVAAEATTQDKTPYLIFTRNSFLTN